MRFSTIHAAVVALLISSAAALPAPRISSQESLATPTYSKASTLPAIPSGYRDLRTPKNTGHHSVHQESEHLEDRKDYSELIRRTTPEELIAHHNNQAKWHGLAAKANANHANVVNRQIPTAPAHQKAALHQEHNELMQKSQDHSGQSQGHAAAAQHIQGLVAATKREKDSAQAARAAAAQHRGMYDLALRNGRSMGEMAHHEHNERTALTAAETHDRNAATYHHQASHYHDDQLHDFVQR